MAAQAPPRIFGIVATEAPVVAIIRRGPTDWAHVGRLDLERLSYEAGAWFHGRLFAQKCDLSPDGRWLAYSAHKSGADWEAGEIYEAVSRLPWLDALAAWEAGTTYTRGMHFVAKTTGNALGEPDVGNVAPLLERYGLSITAPAQFAVERRRGWVESAGTPTRNEGGHWDEARTVTMERRSPTMPEVVLRVGGGYAAFRDNPDMRDAAVYTVHRGSERDQLDAQWADWGPNGELIMADLDGRLSVRPGGTSEAPSFEVDLSAAAPDPAPAPDWAGSW